MPASKALKTAASKARTQAVMPRLRTPHGLFSDKFISNGPLSMFQLDHPIRTIDLPLQDSSHEIWGQKYQLRDSSGNPVDTSVSDTKDRVAWALASVEANPKKWFKIFRDTLEFAIPAGRITSNAGAIDHKRSVSLINCVVSGTIEDSMDSIFGRLHQAALSLKAGCGIGYEFSTLRYRGAFVHGAGAETSGPLTFMDVYDKGCFTVSSAGGRRGAQMATFDVTHPDTPDFIRAKRENGRLRQFNLSCLITDKFMRRVQDGGQWDFLWDEKVVRSTPVEDLWNLIMKSTYDFAEPGFLLIDRINRMNPLWFMEWIRATNPCGEQPLPPFGSCLLGSIDLPKFVRYPLQREAYFDFTAFYDVVRIFSRMLDNVVELNGLPLAEQRHEITTKRRHGMGYLGLGTAMSLLGMRYGDQDSIEFTEQVSKMMALAGFEEGARLASEKGEAIALTKSYDTDAVDVHNRRIGNTNFVVKSGKHRMQSGRELFLQSHYFDEFRNCKEGQAVLKDMAKYGSRYTHHSSIAPTGTISLSLGNNCSNGCEPSFAHEYIRNVIKPGKLAKIVSKVRSAEMLYFKHLVENTDLLGQKMDFETLATIEGGLNNSTYDVSKSTLDQLSLDNGYILPKWFSSADNLTPKAHVDIQAASQRWVDSSISKTINVPTNIPFSDFKDIYVYAYKMGLKGCTTFRFNPEVFQGVLVREGDLTKTLYTLELEDGTRFDNVPGDTIFTIDGVDYTAANLVDAVKEGYYGKF